MSYQSGKCFSFYLLDLKASGEMKVVEDDYSGPVPTERVQKTDVYLILSWVVILFAICYGCCQFSNQIRLAYTIISNIFNYERAHLHVE